MCADAEQHLWGWGGRSITPTWLAQTDRRTNLVSSLFLPFSFFLSFFFSIIFEFE
jgi:hypothetical protein